MKSLFLVGLLPLFSVLAADGQSRPHDEQPVLISNCLRQAPNGIAWVVRDSAAFVLNPVSELKNHQLGRPGPAAPDDSYHLYSFKQGEARIVFEWGRVGDGVAGRITSDKNTDLSLELLTGWPNWTSTFQGTQDGAIGHARAGAADVKWQLRTSPRPKATSEKVVTLALVPGQPVHLVAGLGELPAFAPVEATLAKARKQYLETRPQASGDWDDFIGAISDNLNNTRIYANDNRRLAHTVSRGWFKTPNTAPYFCWDSFFNANLAAIDDPVIARNTVRAILSCQTPEGAVPNYGHWDHGSGGVSIDRSQPPVGSLCVWKMHQRYLDDLDFLKEVYPRLVIWHDWWPKHRDAKQDGLLEWGSTTGGFQEAQWETGWDDNLHFEAAHLVGKTMNCYAIDLCAMWAMDAHYLALLADALGKADDARRFRADETAMNKRINERLWNAELRSYCSRFWDDAILYTPVPAAAFAPGFEGEYFSDKDLKNRVGTRPAATLAFKWKGKPPLEGIGATQWSARWKGTMAVPETAMYRFVGAADDGIRVYVDGKCVIDEWRVHASVTERTAEVSLEKGRKAEIVVDYFQQENGSELRLAVERIEPSNGRFLTRLTPMNFYPLSGGAPDAGRAKDVLGLMTNPKKFWGKYLLPTLAYDDPDWHQQDYWRGKVWAPVNYIVFDGLKRYAEPGQIADYADRSVNLFMSNWISQGVCGENYMSSNGRQSSDPHYTWGALLCLIGLESIVDVDDAGQIVLNGAQTKTIALKNIPLLGKRYDVRTAPGSATLLRDGKVVLEAKGEIVRAKLN